jgi:hypothetical protein
MRRGRPRRCSNGAAGNNRAGSCATVASPDRTACGSPQRPFCVARFPAPASAVSECGDDHWILCVLLALLFPFLFVHAVRATLAPPSPLAGEGGVPRSGAPGEGRQPPGFSGPHLIALRAICPLPQGERKSDLTLAMHPHPSFGNERHEVFASEKIRGGRAPKGANPGPHRRMRRALNAARSPFGALPRLSLRPCAEAQSRPRFTRCSAQALPAPWHRA